MKQARQPSLRRRLVVQLLLLQIGILFAFGFAFICGLILVSDGGAALRPAFTEAVVNAIIRQSDGSLKLQETDALVALRKTTPDLWFVARAEDGSVVESGPVPRRYAELGRDLAQIAQADITEAGSDRSHLIAVRQATGPAGHFTVLGKAALINKALVALWASALLMAPILVLLALITSIAIPFIVGRSLSRLANVAREAEAIDIDRRGNRLSKAAVPVEILPLVGAINGALQRLDDGYKRQQRFILDAAHELRTPIAILQTRLDALPALASRSRLLADSARIASLAEQLLDTQRLGQDGGAFQPIDLTDLCRDVVADFAPLAIAAGYDLALEVIGAPASVRGDAGALERVMTNLVRNAIEHAGGSGQIIVRVGSGAIVEVIDEGPGIPEEERETIFEPFHRLKPRDHGAGLGLNLAREIAARHGGQISANSTKRGGACFRLVLPPMGPMPPSMPGDPAVPN